MSFTCMIFADGLGARLLFLSGTKSPAGRVADKTIAAARAPGVSACIAADEQPRLSTPATRHGLPLAPTIAIGVSVPQQAAVLLHMRYY